MDLFTFLQVLALLVVAALAQEATNTTAPISENNPSRVTFQAVLQSDKPVQGQITGVSNDNGTGVNFNVNFFSFPDVSVGPFNYHVHQYPVPTSGNCTATGEHLDPFVRGTSPPCDPVNPGNCQVGDLTGKHGNISTLTSTSAPDGPGTNDSAVASFQAMYLDLYLSTDPQNVAFFGNLSVVVHAANGTRLNCANFTQMLPSTAFGSGNGTDNSTSSTTATGSPSHTGTANGAEMAKMQVFMTLGAIALAVVRVVF